MSIFCLRHLEKPDYQVSFHEIRATEGVSPPYENYLTLGFIQRSTTNCIEKLPPRPSRFRPTQYRPNIAGEPDTRIERIQITERSS